MRLARSRAFRAAHSVITPATGTSSERRALPHLLDYRRELFLISISQNGAITHLSALLTDRGIAAGKAALAVSAMGGAILAGRLLTGWLLDRYFAPRVAVCLFALSALGTFCWRVRIPSRWASGPPR